MMRSLYSGVSGLKTHQTKMDVIGNNIANVNTVAFKSSGVTFADIMYQTTSGASGATETTGGVNPKQIGLGVQSGSTKVSITSTGSAQSTGDALDIKLTDANSTNFFIVNNGSSNLFTRSGSFYLDGNGNLAMTSTGYLVQGWQVDKNTMSIVKDTVSPLRIMQAENLTSAPEATTDANASGVIDKNDTNVKSESGYTMSLSLYDNLGYAYTAKFSVKGLDTDDKLNLTGATDAAGQKTENDGLNTYTVKLTAIYDQKNNDILKDYLNNQASIQTLQKALQDAKEAFTATDTTSTEYQTQLAAVQSAEAALEAEENAVIEKIFGKASNYEATDYDVSANYKYSGGIYTTADGNYQYNPAAPSTTGTPVKGNKNGIVENSAGELGVYMTSTLTPPEAEQFVSLQKLFGLTAKQSEAVKLAMNANAVDTSMTCNVSITGSTLHVFKSSVNYSLNFNAANGVFDNINGDTAVDLNMAVLGDQFSNIAVDFTKVLNYDNGKVSTLGVDRGTATNAAVGAGKKLGALTGVSIQQDGKIYGSYDNGNTVLLGQIAVAQFANASGLEALGNNCYGTTLNSGDFDGIGRDITADGGSMSTGQLEMSNVDLSSEFTEMITTQRGFQANSRIITVSDTMLEELTNLKR